MQKVNTQQGRALASLSDSLLELANANQAATHRAALASLSVSAQPHEPAGNRDRNTMAGARKLSVSRQLTPSRAIETRALAQGKTAAAPDADRLAQCCAKRF